MELETQKFLLSYNSYELAINAISTEPYNIIVKEYDDRILLLYNQISSPRNNNIVNECRGLILSKDFKSILSRPFGRFYIYGEENADNLDFNFENALVQEKADGTLIQVYHDNEKWCVGTKGKAFAEGVAGKHNNISFKTMFLQSAKFETEEEFQAYFNSLPHDSKEYTYLFELIGPQNRIVTLYQKQEIRFLDKIHKEQGELKEYSGSEQERYLLEFEILAEAKRNRFSSLQMFEVNSYQEVMEKLEKLNELDEGFVCIERGSRRRIKLKQMSYFYYSYLCASPQRKISNAIELIFKNEQHEYLVLFPEDTKLYQYILDKYTNIIENIETQWKACKNAETKKDFAICVAPLQYKTILFLKRANINTPIKDILNEQTLINKTKLIGDVPLELLE